MSHDMAPQASQGQNLDKAQYILNGMSRYRIDPIRVKIPDTAAVGRGGQGVVVVGTLLPRKGFKETRPEVLEELCSDRHKELVPETLKESPPKGLKESLPKELMKLNFEATRQLIPELDVAVKKLEWPRDDAEELEIFFKSFVNELSLMASIYHANIIKFLSFVEDMKKGDAWIILPWEPNGNVREFLQSGEWDIPERISLAFKVRQRDCNTCTHRIPQFVMVISSLSTFL
ncbi:hypothetical protein M407DRAFT_26497 [Tulasnella calospora MUT 4182]|uniref:Protein kinase domain-containing protein n=1 Tax=Tulasnella calospora MUT 4182 TaxID=1051891 RepID=A0A0C3Q4T6_9AGAM|nr:hypothetical protein M407DRAFT_26497 [Tulasnella calospora MUT 4182]